MKKSILTIALLSLIFAFNSCSSNKGQEEENEVNQEELLQETEDELLNLIEEEENSEAEGTDAEEN
jgi:hypothetical protein